MGLWAEFNWERVLVISSTKKDLINTSIKALRLTAFSFTRYTSKQLIHITTINTHSKRWSTRVLFRDIQSLHPDVIKKLCGLPSSVNILLPDKPWCESFIVLSKGISVDTSTECVRIPKIALSLNCLLMIEWADRVRQRRECHDTVFAILLYFQSIKQFFLYCLFNFHSFSRPFVFPSLSGQFARH